MVLGQPVCPTFFTRKHRKAPTGAKFSRAPVVPKVRLERQRFISWVLRGVSGAHGVRLAHGWVFAWACGSPRAKANGHPASKYTHWNNSGCGKLPLGWPRFPLQTKGFPLPFIISGTANQHHPAPKRAVKGPETPTSSPDPISHSGELLNSGGEQTPFRSLEKGSVNPIFRWKFLGSPNPRKAKWQVTLTFLE